MVSQSDPGRIERIFRDGEAIDRALREAVADALARHKREGQSIAVADNGGVRVLTAAEIPEQK